MKNKFASYLLAIGAFAFVMTGCGGKKEETSEPAAPAAGAPAGKTVDSAKIGRAHV